jgi:SAM-dependent methyltransferase
MAWPTPERVLASRPALGLKRLLGGRFPGVYDRLRRGYHGARRAMKEPPAPRVGDERLFWDPPPRRLPVRPNRPGEVTEKLFARLDADDLAALEARLEGPDAEFWAGLSEEERRWVALPFGVHYGIEGIVAKTGLSRAMPPGDWGGAGGGPLAAGGSSFYADLLADPLREAGIPLAPGQRALDFGGAAGRVTRVLAAAYPDLEWHCCDPDRVAIEWASEHLPGIHFFVSDVDPPLPFPDSHLDVVYASGVFTHFSAEAARRWLAEIRRVLRPGGALVFTVHGLQALQMHAGDWGGWDRRRVAEAATALWSDGFAFVGAYGKEGHHRLASADWGEAFMTPEWVLSELCPDWAVLHFEAGWVEGNLDLYVAQAR